MTSTDPPMIAATLLRCTVGAFMIPHGLQKLGFIGGNRAFETQAFNTLGLRPGNVWSAIAGVTQAGLGLLLLIGLFTRPAAALTAVFMVFAALVGVRKNGWYWHNHGMEFAFFWALAAIVVALLGSGPWALDHLGAGAHERTNPHELPPRAPLAGRPG